MTTGERMKKAREDRGLTQADLESLSGVNRLTIRACEKGHRKHSPRLDTVVLLADALGISLDEYIGREVPEVKPEGFM